MRGASQFVGTRRSERWISGWGAIAALSVALTLPAAAQMHGPPSTNTINGHFLAPAPSVTSIGGRHLPPPAPSVTSIPNFGYQYHHGNYSNGYFHGHGYRNGGFAYSTPYYYYPLDDPNAYGYDYVGNGSPDLYSGPPLGPDQNPHIVVEQPPARPYSGYPPDAEAYGPPPTPPARQAPPAPAVEVKPGEPSVLVFRDGHRQEVINYAIMGDTVYLFDKTHKKIALADLDIPATIRANDDRGLEFRVPAASGKKSSTLPQSATPEQPTPAPSKVASAMPSAG